MSASLSFVSISFLFSFFFSQFFYCCNSVSLLSIFIEIVFDSRRWCHSHSYRWCCHCCLSYFYAFFMLFCHFHCTFLFRAFCSWLHLNRIINSTIVFFFTFYTRYEERKHGKTHARYSYTDSVSVKAMYCTLFKLIHLVYGRVKYSKNTNTLRQQASALE